MMIVGCHGVSFAAPEYRLIELGNLGDPRYTAATDINDLGMVVGISAINDEEGHAFRWINGEMIDLVPLCDDGEETLQSASGISMSGRVIGGAGFSWIDDNAYNVAACIEGDSIAFEIPAKCKYNEGANAMNSNGTLIAGHCIGDNLYNTFLPVLYDVDDASTVLIGLFPGMTLDSYWGYAFDVNNSEQVVGTIYSLENDVIGFLWHEGMMTKIENPFGFENTAVTAINNRGLAAGNVLWAGGDDAMTYNTITGEMTILGDGYAEEMNDRGHVAGTDIIDLSGIHVILYKDGEAFDLASHFPPEWSSFTVEGINNYGWIVGDARNFEAELDPTLGWLLIPIYSKGDYDGDDDVDLHDFGHFQECYSAEPYQGPEGGLHVGCSVFDFNDDVDLDGDDFAAFQAAFTGAITSGW